MNKRDHKIYLRDKQNLETRLVRKQYEDQPDSMFKDSNIHYEIAERTRAISFGGIGALHKLVCKLKLDKAVNENIVLLQRHVPYWESDHVLNIAYNVLTGGACLEDIERLRNENFLAAGNPGFVGSLSPAGLAGIMEQGYVAGGNDTGHVDPGFEWAMGHPEKWADWGYRAVHEMVVVTKTLAEAFYAKPIKFSYWNSCHNGGNQGLNEAQRYPEDFDGIVAGDPAYFISHLQPGSLYISWAALKDGVDGPGYIPAPKLEMLNKAVIEACNANDGLADGLIEDPTRCDFDPASIQCSGADAPDCLTAGQVDTVNKIYEGAKFNDGTPDLHRIRTRKRIELGLYD